MPEGHTLHRLAHDLNDVFAGLRPSVTSPQGRVAASAAQLDHTAFIEATAHGKHLFIGFDHELILHVHLGLIGKFQFTPLAAPRGEVRLRIATDAIAADLRGPQACAIRTADEVSAQIAALGPDPLRADADPDLAWKRIHNSGRPIAALLMDQTVLSGVGNVYRAEVLFRQKIHPYREGKKLQRKSWNAIWDDLLNLMPFGARDNKINTVNPDHTPEAMGRAPRVDDHGGEVYVYRRNGQACYVCGSRVRTEVLAGRNLFWCGKCQRRG